MAFKSGDGSDGHIKGLSVPCSGCGDGDYESWRGWLHLDGWEGRTRQGVLVVGETPKRYRITPDDGGKSVKLAGRQRWLPDGDSALVPRYAVTPRT